MFYTSSSQVTNDIRISAWVAFIPEQTSIADCRYVFAYRIKISNESLEEVQLVSRHWDITDSLGYKRVVEGEGVVGQQPILEPNEEYVYISGCVLGTPIGKMKGYYNMIRTYGGSTFQVEIPEFILIPPHFLN